MVDDNKRQPFQDDTASQDQQKGGEATATDQDVADLGQDTDVPSDTSDVEETSTDESNLTDDTSTDDVEDE